MATVPMMTQPADANADHRVTAPGGYESWHFDAVDIGQNVQVGAAFLSGSPEDEAYLHRYRRFMRRPTLRRPPAPKSFSHVALGVSRGGTAVAGFEAYGGAYQASAERLDVSIGSDRAYADHGRLRIQISDGSTVADLAFEPLVAGAPVECVIQPPEHRWIVAAPWCRVSGTVRWPSERVTIDGLGYHDHHFGTAPPSLAFSRWMRERTLEATGAKALLVVRSADQRDTHVRLVQADAQGVREMRVAEELSGGCRSLDGFQRSLPNRFGLNDHTLQRTTASARYMAPFGQGMLLGEVWELPAIKS